jgi:anti-sigma factor RsiW
VLTCREFVEFLMEFINEELEPDRRRLFLRHIAGCRDCAAYLESYRTTVALSRTCADSDEVLLEGAVPRGLIRAIVAARRNANAHFWHLIGAIAASPLLLFYFGS